MPDLEQGLNRTLGADPLPKRILEWFWRGAALAEKRAALGRGRVHGTILAQRAKATADVAALVWSSPPYKPSGEAIACELYRQAIYWALCALSTSAANAALDKHYSEAVWTALDQQLSPESTDGGSISAASRVSLATGSFVDFAELEPAEQVARSSELRRVSSLLLGQLNQQRRALNAIIWQRIWRLCLVLSLLFVGIFSVQVYERYWEEHHELAAGKPWRTSTSYGSGGCRSPDQGCPGASAWFFHTQEQDPNPWIELELGAGQSVSTVLIDNRTDCCPERAVPLAVEVSEDQKHWRQVAQRDAVFTQWRASFSTVRARWLRLRVLRPSTLHLARIRVFP